MPLSNQELFIRISSILDELRDARNVIRNHTSGDSKTGAVLEKIKNKPVEFKAIKNHLKSQKGTIPQETQEKISQVEDILSEISEIQKGAAQPEPTGYPVSRKLPAITRATTSTEIPGIKPAHVTANPMVNTGFLQNGLSADRMWSVLLVSGVLLSILISIYIAYGEFKYNILLIGGILGIFLTLVIFLKPELAVYLLIITTVTNLSDLFTESGLPSINQPVVALALLCILANQLLKTGRVNLILKITPVEWALALYFVIVTASVFVANDRSTATEIIIVFTKNIVILYCIIIALNTPEKWKRGIWLTIIFAAILSSMGAFQLLTGNTDFTFFGLAKASILGQFTDEGVLRYGGPIGDSNVWAQILVSVVPLGVYRVLREKSPAVKVFSLVAVLLILSAVFYTYSRGAFFATALILAFIAWERRIELTKALFILGIGLTILAFLPQAYLSRLGTLVDILSPPSEYSVSEDESFLGRLSVMKVGFEMFSTHPFLGIGVGNYPGEYWSYAPKVGVEANVITTDQATISRQPHNLFIEVLAETGIFGIMSFLGFIFILFRTLGKTRKEFIETEPSDDWSAWISSINFAVLSYLISGLFLHGVFFRYFWLFIALAMAAIHLPKIKTPVAKSTRKFRSRFID